MNIVIYKYKLYITKRFNAGSLRAEDVFNIIIDMFRPIGIMVKTTTNIGGYSITGIAFDFRSRKVATLKWISDTINSELGKDKHPVTIAIGTLEIEPEISKFTQEQIDKIEAGFNSYIVADKVLT